MLQSLDQLSAVGVRVIKASKTATIDSLRQLQPVLNQLAASGDDFVNAFNVFLTYPFVDEVVGRDPQVARNLHMGDYTNLSITLDVDLTKGLLPTNPTDVLPTQLDPGQLVHERARLHRQRQPRPAPPARRCSTRPRRCSSSRSSARSPPTGTRPCACCSTPSPACRGLPVASPSGVPAGLPTRVAQHARRPRAGPQRHRTVERRRPRRARPWPSSRRSTTRRWSTCWCPELVVSDSGAKTHAKGGRPR